MQEQWLSVDEIAPDPGVKPDTTWKGADATMPADKAGRLWKFLASEVDAGVKGGQTAQGAKEAAQTARKIRARNNSKT